MPEVCASVGDRAFGAPLRVDTVTTIAEWRGFASDWDRLLRVTCGYTGLQSFDFLSTWWGSFGGRRRLWIVTFWDESELVGIAPFQLVERRILGKRYRVLQFLGMTEDILRPTVLFPPAHLSVLLSDLNRYLIKRRQDWDIIELDELACGDPLIDSLQQLADDLGLAYKLTPFHTCPFLDLRPHSLESYSGTRSRKLRKNLRAGERQLGQQGPVKLQVYESPEDIGRGFEQFRKLAKLSWKFDAKVGISDDPRYETFYAQLLEKFAQRNGARVLILTVSDCPIAATLGFVFDATYHSLQIVHDEAYARYSPGTLLESRELELLLRRSDVERYEFMGGALSNKLRWTDTSVDSVCLRLMRPDLRVRAVGLYKTTKHIAKYMLKRARSAMAALRMGVGS